MRSPNLRAETDADLPAETNDADVGQDAGANGAALAVDASVDANPNEVSLAVPIASGSDDGSESQALGPQTAETVGTNLPLGQRNAVSHLVAVRFQNLSIPKDAIIPEA
ncbi:MAG: hypothetical protein GY811_21940 [Myxococcales bacterium]|nr:hypothetical protein [Myxococcales bacterium]